MRVFADHSDTGPDVLAAFRVVGGTERHHGGPGGVHARDPRVQVSGGQPDASRVAADIARGEQRGPSVERGVLDALGHQRAADLLEPDGELAADPGIRVAAQRGQVTEPREGGEERDGKLPGGPVGRVAQRGERLGVRFRAGTHVGPVAIQPHEQFAQAEAQLRLVRIARDVDLQPPHQVRQSCDIDGQGRVGQQPLGLPLSLGPAAGVGPVGVGCQRHQGLVGGRIQLHRIDSPRRFVPRRARHRPGVWQEFRADQDLLRHHPGTSGRGVQAFEVLLWVGQAVGVVDAEAVDVSRVQQFQQQRVGGVEHLGPFDADADQCGHVEEAAVGERRAG